MTDYLADLSKIGDDLREWATRLLVVVPTGEPSVEPPADTAAADRRTEARSVETAPAPPTPTGPPTPPWATEAATSCWSMPAMRPGAGSG